MEELLQCKQPMLIGVRHHSAALAKAIPRLLDERKPKAVLIELPTDFQEWLPYLADPTLEAPVALAGSRANGFDLHFYPFADFSPELAAVRWAQEHDIPIVAIDLPVAQRGQPENDESTATDPSNEQEEADKNAPDEGRRPAATGLLRRLLRLADTDDVGALWERLVESPAAGASAESVRRAALLFGWALRADDGIAQPGDLQRETFMRQQIANAPANSAVVIGAYHAAALLPDPLLYETVEPKPATAKESLQTALIPYTFGQLDERSGYPAGIRDPIWHQRVWEADTVDALDHVVSDLAVGVCRQVREGGHPAATADSQEVVRMARDLARLRNLATPGRAELIESIQCSLAQGQLLGRGRALARAMDGVLVGNQIGRLPKGTPVSGIEVDLQYWLAKLKLPTAFNPKQKEPKRMRLDPLRSKLDRGRVVLFHRLRLCHIEFARPFESETLALRENLTEQWDVLWRHSTDATIQFAASLGATVLQATHGGLRRTQAAIDQPTTADKLEHLERAAEAGLAAEVERSLSALDGPFLQEATLPELTQAVSFIERARRGHIPGLPTDEEHVWDGWIPIFRMPPEMSTTPLLEAAIGRLEGMQGSDTLEDVNAIVDLALLFQRSRDDAMTVDDGRLLWSLRKMRTEGSGMMQGAGLGALLLLGDADTTQFGEQLASWSDAAIDAEGHTLLRSRFQGAIRAATSIWLGDPHCFDRLERRLAALTDREFLGRLPALRGGFHAASPMDRSRLLKELLQQLPDGSNDGKRPAASFDPALTAFRASADEAGKRAVTSLMPDLKLLSAMESTGDSESERQRTLTHANSQISLADRWRLLLGSPPSAFSQGSVCCRAAGALDELYGAGAGEQDRGSGGGQEGGYPSTREWSEDLESLFGEDVREEVMGQAAEQGRVAALDLLDPDSVRPSVGLLQQVLSLQGSLPAGREAQLRKLAERVTRQLAEQLARKLRPALTGLSTARPTRRRTQRLDLRRTIQANLRNVHFDEHDQPVLVPEQLIFRSRSRRTMDWHVIFVVDISGSMEASVIYSALVATILNGLPAISVQFLAFNTEVIEFTQHVNDPLTLLLEVQVGGGTHIAKGIHAARQRLTVPSRTIVLLVSDFEEGFGANGLFAEVEALGNTGAKMLGLAALDDDGAPRYHQGIAAGCVARGMPVAALSPLELARWVGEQVQ